MSSAELLDITFAQIDEQEPRVRAFLSFVDRERLQQKAVRIDEARANGKPVHTLAGVPIAVKDNIAIAQHHLTCGSRMLENYVSPFSATVIERLEKAGVLLIGKTNMDEFGFGSSTENSAFFPTRNPHALDRVPGGTSGGSAAAVAAGIVPAALGTDTGGSVRQPASLCGVVGFRPSYGRVSRYGLVAYASSMDQIGPLARTVDDATSLLSIIGGHDPRDSTSCPGPFPSGEYDLSTVRIGIPREYLTADCDQDVLSAMEVCTAVASRLGWKVETVSLPLTGRALSIYYIAASVEAASNLARYDGVIYGHRAGGARDYNEMATRTRTEGFGDEAKRRIMLGTFASSFGYRDQYYESAMRGRRLLAAEFDAAFQKVDIIMSPVSPTTAWRLGDRISDPMKMYLSDVLSVSAPLAAIPAIVIPGGRDRLRLPIGIQLSGPRLGDELVLSVARVLERELGYSWNE